MRGYLPHVKREGASYFVTFRLADSLPKAVLLNFEREKANDFVGYGILKAAARPLTIQRKKLRASSLNTARSGVRAESPNASWKGGNRESL